ncbi:MAG: NnrU family protein [Proteobacteria bacterium]|nr:NnrU family protein [Pseudomonadota bacterium]
MTLTGTIGHLVVPTAIFLGVHILVSGTPLRRIVVRVIGEGPYAALFSLISLGGLVWMVFSFREAPFIAVWQIPHIAWVGIVVMPVALIFAIAGLTTKGPSLSGSGADDTEDKDIAIGIVRITRHPFQWAVALWSASHLIANGDVASLIFFGALLVLSLAGPHLIDAKQRNRNPDRFARISAVTSNLPFAAIFAGHTQLSIGEIGWWRIALASILYVLLLFGHGWVFGAPILG